MSTTNFDGKPRLNTYAKVLGPVLFCSYIHDLPLHKPSHSAECHMLATPHFMQQEKALLQLQLCLDCISVWCNTNPMLINHANTKSMVITTRQKHRLSDLSLSLLLDGQNIENVTEHRLLGLIVDNKFRWQAQTEHICKSVSKKKKKKSFCFLKCNISSTSIPEKSLSALTYNFTSIMRQQCGMAVAKYIFFLNSLHRKAGKLILPDSTLSIE